MTSVRRYEDGTYDVGVWMQENDGKELVSVFKSCIPEPMSLHGAFALCNYLNGGLGREQDRPSGFQVSVH